MRRGRDLSVLYAFSFLKSLNFFGAVAVPFYLYRIKLDYGRMFILEAVFSAAMMILEVPTGIVADRWGRKISLAWGSVFLALGFLVFGIFRNFWVLVGAEVLCALGMTLVSGADKSLLYETIKAGEAGEEPTTIFARYEAAGTAGMFVAFPAGSLFAGSGIVGYEHALGLVFVATAIAFGIAGVIILSVKERRTKHSNEGFMKQGVGGFLYIFRIPELRGFALDYSVISAFTFYMFWFYQSLLLRYKVPVGWFGFVGAGFNLAATLLLSATPMVKKKLGVGGTLVLSSLVPGLLYIAAGIIPGLGVALIAIYGVTTFRLFRAPMLSALMNEWIEDRNRATVLSGVSMIEKVLIALLYPVVGALADRSLDAALVVLGVLTVASSLFLRTKRK
ncbi:MAG: MFS transporter [Spirochaetes bacterium]|nr:MFS transporter [Spirochaetota bacterium]